MKSKLGTTFLVAMFALAGIGISYAGFTDEIYIYGEAQTATVEICVIDYSSTEVWKVWGEGDGVPDNELHYEHFDDYPTPGEDVWDPDFAGLLDIAADYPDLNTEFVAGAYAHPCYQEVADGPAVEEPPCYDTVCMDFVNMFPCQDFKVDFVVEYKGSIPAKLLDFVVDTGEITGDFPEAEYGGLNWLEYLWELGMIQENPDFGIHVWGYKMEQDESGAWVDTDEVVLPGFQFHNGFKAHIFVEIHLPQDDDFQGLGGSFETTLVVKQWNEVDGDGNDLMPNDDA